jgi:transposase InsO family protein
MPFDVAQQLEALTRMSAPQLRELWQRTVGRAHSGYVQKDFLVRAIAYRLQEKAYGGLSPALRRRLLLDWLIPLSESHLRSILKEWVAHYNGARPHAALGSGNS